MSNKPSLTIRRRFKATPSKVFAAWTDPVLMARWWSPDKGPVLHAESDLRVGGAFAVRFRMEDGSEHGGGGVYREIVRDEKLVYIWRWDDNPQRETRITMLLKPDGDGTLMTFTQEFFEDETVRDLHIEGWNGAFDNLDALFT